MLHVGDFGIWPEPNRIDRATRDHGGAGDFPAWFAAKRPAPRPTLFIKGNHEDFAWLDCLDGHEALPGLLYLLNGCSFDLAPSSIRVCFFSHHHSRLDAEIGGVRCIGLNRVGMPGNLVAVDLDDDGPGWSVIGEWPERR